MRTAKEMMEVALDYAKFTLIDEAAGTQIMPTFWIQYEGRPGEMITAPWDGDDEKMAVVEIIRDKLRDPRADAYSFVSEVWVATEDVGKPRVQPSQHPKRREQVMIQAFDRRGKGGMKNYDIKRNRAGQVMALVEDKDMDSGRWEGRLFNLFTRAHPGVVPRGHAPPPTTRMRPSKCLDCGRKIDAGTDVTTHDTYRSPRPGDVAICLHCSHLMMYADDLRVRALTDAEMIEIAGDPDVVQAVNAIARLKAQKEAQA